MSRRRNDLDDVRREITEEGARIAYEALKRVCQDPKAPAQAKAAAGVAILRAGGLYEPKARPDEDPAEMSAAELRQALPVLQAELERAEARLAGRGAVDVNLFD